MLKQPDYQNPVRRSQFSPSPIKKAPSSRGTHSNSSQALSSRVAGKHSIMQTVGSQPIHLFTQADGSNRQDTRKSAKPLPLQLTDNKENYEQSPMTKVACQRTASTDGGLKEQSSSQLRPFATPNATDHLIKVYDDQNQLA